jgi:hypothetical protein
VRLAARSVLRVLGPALLAACSAGSGAGETAAGESEETGGPLVPTSGTWEFTLATQTSDCRTVEESSMLVLELALPEHGGAWMLDEGFDGEDVLRAGPIDCNLEVGTSSTVAICLADASRDYTAEGMGVLAEVTARRNLQFDWSSETTATLDARVDLLCEGSSCPELAGDYQVVAWDCITNARFDGALQ